MKQVAHDYVLDVYLRDGTHLYYCGIIYAIPDDCIDIAVIVEFYEEIIPKDDFPYFFGRMDGDPDGNAVLIFKDTVSHVVLNNYQYKSNE
jgi:hypothetical protein